MTTKSAKSAHRRAVATLKEWFNLDRGYVVAVEVPGNIIELWNDMEGHEDVPYATIDLRDLIPPEEKRRRRKK